MSELCSSLVRRLFAAALASAVIYGMNSAVAFDQTPVEPIRLRLLSYNIHHAEGTDRKTDLQRIANVIRSVQPDVVALQEVDQNATRTGNVDQPQKLARLVGMNVEFGPNIELQGGHYGNAVLSRYPLVSSRNYLLPVTKNGEQRGVLVVEVEVPDVDRPLLLLATHLDHRRDPAERIQSAEVINSLVSNNTRQAVLMGDMNDVVGSTTIKTLDTAWSRSNAKPLATVPVVRPNRQIDFIFVRPADRWKVLETRVLDEAVASDHRAVFSHIELRIE